MIASIMRVLVGRIAREHDGEVVEGRPGVAVAAGVDARYLGIVAPSRQAADRMMCDGRRAGLGAPHTSCGPSLLYVVWWDGSQL